MHTGENHEGLRKILDMTRLISIAVLGLHFYYYCYTAFQHWELTAPLADRILGNIERTGLFAWFHKSKIIALAFLAISLLGVKGKKDEKISYKMAAAYIVSGLAIYFAACTVLLPAWAPTLAGPLYMAVTTAGYILALTGGTILSRVIQLGFSNDIFNHENETFPQEERLLTNPYSINLPAKYYHKSKWRKSWINIINPFRGVLVVGSPGAGKTYFVVQHVIKQLIEKQFTMFIYDFKYPDLSLIAYNYYLKCRDRYKVTPSFYVINFDDLNRSHRCNVVPPSSLMDISDATDGVRTLMLGLNRSFIKRQGEFFVESPINFVTAILWFLRQYQDGEFCTLPHCIELANLEYDRLFSILQYEETLHTLLSPFINAYKSDVMEQLEGQLGAAKIALGRLSSPQLYWILSGNDFTLDINNPKEPKIVCVGNNPGKVQTYGAVLSLYINRMNKLVNQQGKEPCAKIYDEYPSITVMNMDSAMATERSNKCCTILAIQDANQLRKEYGKEEADTILGIAGNVIFGQTSGDTAKHFSERMGKTLQARASYSINRTDTSISHSKQLESVMPPSKIASFSAGEFGGIVADDPDCPIKLKAFHNYIQNDHVALKREKEEFQEFDIIRQVTPAMVHRNFLQIRQDVQDIADDVLARMMEDPVKMRMIVIKDSGK